MGLIPITFDKGLNLRNDPLLLKDGELSQCEGFSYKHNGVMEARPALNAVNMTGLGSIHTMHRYINWILAGAGSSLYYKWDLDGFCNRYVPANGEFTLLTTMRNSRRLAIADSDLFTFMVNGADQKAFSHGNIYDWGIPNPSLAPAAAAGASGNPTGAYSLYYTWVIHFPNGFMYETGPSPAGTITVTSTKITWGGVAPCPYSGTGLIIYRRLYRYSVTLNEKYLVTEITDNTTTTYTDNVTDAILQTQAAMSTIDYLPPPDGLTDICAHLGRIFGVKGNMLYWSEAYIPFAFPGGNSIQVSIEGENLLSVVSWQEQIFMASIMTWYRLQGATPDVFAVKTTFAEVGTSNTHSVKKTRYGIISKWHDGLYIFTGATSANITNALIGTDYFTGIDFKTDFGSTWDGLKYSLQIPSLQTSEADIYTGLLLHCDGTDASVSFPDASINTRTITPAGNAQVDTAQYKFGTGSALMDGAGDYLSAPAIVGQAIGTGKFTVDFWARFNPIKDNNGLFSQITDANNYVSFVMRYNVGRNYFSFKIVEGGVEVFSLLSAFTDVKTTSFYHFAIIKGWGGDPNIIAITMNGTSIASGIQTQGSRSWPYLTGALNFGYAPYGSSNYSLDGWMDEIEILYRERWTAAFTPPVAPYAIVNSYVVDPTLPENVLAVDFRNYPSLRFFDDNINVYSDYYHRQTAISYLGHKDGYQYKETGVETIGVTLQTGDRGGENILQQKQLEYLYYEADTNGQDLIATIYVDGTAHSAPVTINTASRTRGRKSLPAIRGYKFSLKLTCASAQHVKIYQPWGISFNPYGE